jgi:hypothetical protein
MKTMRAITATLLSGLMVVSAMPPQTQQDTPAPASAKTTKFGTTTQLVVVDVTVKGKDGQPLKGLKPSDFTITEDGKKQDIKVFTFQELEEMAAPEPVPAIKAPAVTAKPVEAPSTPPVKSVTASHAEIPQDADDAERPDGHHDLLERSEGAAGFHRR